MPDNTQNFLDKSTLIALGLLILSWLGWSYYMKTKYPPEPARPAIVSTENQKEQKEQEETSLSPQRGNLKHKEKTLEFHGNNMDVVFSSNGFGVKKLTLKGYADRNKKPIVFYHPDRPLFSSFFFKDEHSPIPFKIRKEAGKFIGVFSSPEGKITKTIELKDEQFILSSQTTIEPTKSKKLKGLSLVFSQALNQKKPQGFLSLFLIYSQNVLKAFVSYNDGKSERLEEADFEEPKSYSRMNIVALGDKYFGKALINQSSFLPSVIFKKETSQITARLDYEFLSSKKQNVEYRVFLGPKSLKNFKTLGKGMEQWLDFGFFGWLARPLLLFLNWLYAWCGNWGIAIILLTFFIRLALLPINIKSYKSMKIMQKIQPKIKELKVLHKADPKKMNLEVMALMKSHKANPLGGCLPLFIQFPVFFALYRVLGESIELYQSPFVFWIQDLSLKDPYYVLPVLAGLILFVQQRLTPMNMSKEHARLLAFMPLVFSVFMLGLPSGLTLYIFVSGLFGLAQQFFFVKMESGYFKGGEDVKTI